MQSEQINELAKALAIAQGKIEPAVFDKVNPHFKQKYASLSAIIAAVRGQLSSNGLSVVQTTHVRDGALVLRTTLLHSSGQWLAGEYPLPAAGRPQEMGSAMTYARRYNLSAMLNNSADEDDDAEGAEAAKQKIAPPIASPPVQPAKIAEPAEPTVDKTDALSWVEWGGLFIAVLKKFGNSEAEIDQLVFNHSNQLGLMQAEAPKAHKSVMAALKAKRDSFKEKVS